MGAKYHGPNENRRFTMAELEAMPGFKRTGDTIRCACPIHGGTKPNFEVTLSDGRGHCWSRKCWGYLDDGTHKGKHKPTAPYGSVPTIVSLPAQEAPLDVERVHVLQGLWPRMVRAFPGSPAEAYLANRGIPLAIAQAARVGYDRDGDLWHDTASADTPPAERKRSTHGRVVFPLATFEGKPINAAARRLTLPGNESKKWRWLYLKGPKGYFNAAGLRQAQDERRTLYLCEGMVDALALMAGGITTAVAMGGIDGVVKREHLRGLYRVVLCLDADKAGQASAPEIGRMARYVDCKVEYLTSTHLDGAKDPAEYWQSHGTLPAFLRELAAEEQTDLDDDLITEYALRYSADYIADSLAKQYARWEADDPTPQARKVMADWRAIAARRATIGAEWARTPRDADTGPDDGDTGEAWVEEGR